MLLYLILLISLLITFKNLDSFLCLFNSFVCFPDYPTLIGKYLEIKSYARIKRYLNTIVLKLVMILIAAVSKSLGGFGSYIENIRRILLITTYRYYRTSIPKISQKINFSFWRFTMTLN